MMTDRQLKTLMEWARAHTRFEIAIESRYGETEPHGTNAVQAKRAMYDAFGFVEGADGWPVVPTHPQTLPPAKPEDGPAYHPLSEPAWAKPGAVLATSDPEGHRQAMADADYDAKAEAIQRLIPVKWCAAEEIMRLWPDLKAIMEPNADICRGCGCKRGQAHTSKYLSAKATCAAVEHEWSGE